MTLEIGKTEIGLQRFKRRLARTISLNRGRLRNITGAENIGQAEEQIDQWETHLDWMPEPETPGTGVVGEESKRMSRRP